MVEKLSEMTVDEFFEHGFDSEFEDDDDVETEGKNIQNDSIKDIKKKKEKKRDVGSNKKGKAPMESLKEKDPEFYKFLQENDEDLLAFSGSDIDEEADDENEEDEDDDELSEDDESVEKHLTKDIQEDSEDGSSDEEEEKVGDEKDEDEEEEEEEGDKEVDDVKKGRKVTTKMIERWKKGLEEHSLKSLKCVFRAFRSAVENMSPEDPDSNSKNQKKEKSTYLVESGSMYNNLLKLCLKHSVPILEKNLSTSKQKKFTSHHLPSSNKLWSSAKGALKQYLHDILQLLRVHTDVSVLTILLRHCQALSPFYACFPKISKILLKRLIRMWSSGEEHVRVLAFLCIRTLSFLLPRLYEFIVKKLYLGFVRNSKFVNIKKKPIISFMKNSLVEMFSYNEAATYKHGFLYIRQLAITLRNAITVKKKDAFQSVYNWQYISCLQLWSQVVGDLNSEALKPLIYPIVQLNIGVMQLIPAARYYPLRFHCIESLNYISKKTAVYIPTAAFIVQALESTEFLKKPKSSEKPPDFAGVLKFSKSQLQAKGFQDCTIDLALESILEHYVVFSNSIAFPELIFPICHRLKRLIKKCHVYKLSKDMKMLVDKLQTHAETVKSMREQVTFSPKDLDQVRKWEEERKSTKNDLEKFLETWKNMKQLTDKSTHEEEAEIPVESAKKGNRKRKGNTTKETTDKTTTITKKKKWKKEKVYEFDGNENDIVEDYKLSDDET